MADDEAGGASEAVADQLAAVHLSASSSSDAPGDKRCASCGKAGDGLKRCTACQSVWYCGVQCQIDHRKAHKKECKRIKRELGMWKPPHPTEECPVCLVNLPLLSKKASYWACCGQTVCQACKAETERALNITNRKRKDKKLPPMKDSCAFCRVPVHTNYSEMIKSLEERVGKGDLNAMAALTGYYRDGLYGLVRDEAKALELLHRAADLGFPEAIRNLGCCFLLGDLGVIRDEEKGRTYLEDAAKKGDVGARCILGDLEADCQHHDLAMKHFKLAAAAGDKDSTKPLWKYFSLKKLDKAELEEILRAHHAACDEMNSEERERYEAWKEAEAGDDEILKGIYAHYYEGVMTAKELKVTLEAHGSGDSGKVFTILSKCQRALN